MKQAIMGAINYAIFLAAALIIVVYVMDMALTVENLLQILLCYTLGFVAPLLVGYIVLKRKEKRY